MGCSQSTAGSYAKQTPPQIYINAQPHSLLIIQEEESNLQRSQNDVKSNLPKNPRKQSIAYSVTKQTNKKIFNQYQQENNVKSSTQHSITENNYDPNQVDTTGKTRARKFKVSSYTKPN